MPSSALDSFKEAVEEVVALQRSNPSPSARAPFRQPQIKRAIGRSQVVLLCSHFERYFYHLNEDAIDFLVYNAVSADVFPIPLKLIYSKKPIDSLSQTDWNRREIALRAFASDEVTLWTGGCKLQMMEYDRLLEWMKTPRSQNVERYFRQWGINNIFDAVTRRPTSRTELWMRIDELAEKRNNIAHGDLTVEATHLDVARYLRATRDFVERADRKFGRLLAKLAGGVQPWD